MRWETSLLDWGSLLPLESFGVICDQLIGCHLIKAIRLNVCPPKRLQNSLCWKQVPSLPLAFGLPNCFSVVRNPFFCPGVVNLVALLGACHIVYIFNVITKQFSAPNNINCLIERFSFSSTEHLRFHEHYNFLISSLSFAFFLHMNNCTNTTRASTVAGFLYGRSCVRPVRVRPPLNAIECYQMVLGATYCQRGNVTELRSEVASAADS